MSDCRGYFVTGTDTGVGKTTVTLGLMQALQRQGLSVVAMKPVAAGCEPTPAGLRNGDALRLQGQASVELDYARVNPCAFEPAIAPHLAAERAGETLEIEEITNIFNEIKYTANCVLVEGIGGWQVPLNATETLADLARALGLEVIMVVGIRLGCLNHALLTAQSIRASGCTLAGWVANCLPGAMEAGEASIEALRSRLDCPLLGTVRPLCEVSAKSVADFLSIHPPANT